MTADDIVRILIRCLIYTRISLDKLGDGRGWTVTHRLSDNDIGVTRKDPTTAGKYRPGYEEVLRLVDAHAVDVVLVWKLDRFIREPLDLEYLIPRFDKAGVRLAEVEGSIDLGTDSGRLAARIFIAFLGIPCEYSAVVIAEPADRHAGLQRACQRRDLGYVLAPDDAADGPEGMQQHPGVNGRDLRSRELRLVRCEQVARHGEPQPAVGQVGHLAVRVQVDEACRTGCVDRRRERATAGSP
jgi:hypothetical protein